MAKALLIGSNPQYIKQILNQFPGCEIISVDNLSDLTEENLKTLFELHSPDIISVESNLISNNPSVMYEFYKNYLIEKSIEIFRKYKEGAYQDKESKNKIESFVKGLKQDEKLEISIHELSELSISQIKEFLQKISSPGLNFCCGL